jgi:AcrR family transcriptional regulator
MGRYEEILDAAGRLFSERGYHATSVREIARRLDLQGGSLYAHIDSKEEVLFRIVERAAGRFWRVVENLPEGDPRARVCAFVRGHLEVIVEELPYATVFFHEWKFLKEPYKARIRALRDRYEGALRRLIEEGVEAGVFRVDDPDLAAKFVLGALNWTYQWYRPRGRLGPERLAEGFCRYVLGALGGEG